MTTIFVYVETQDDSIRDRLGTSEYSYYFVLREFYPLLIQLGDVIQVNRLDEQFGQLVEEHKGGPHVLLFFSAPHNLPKTLNCPTIPVFAWEFEDLPQEEWGENAYNDWSTALAAAIGGITHSSTTLRKVKEVMGESNPSWSIPAPVFSRFQSRFTQNCNAPLIHMTEQSLNVIGAVFDSHEGLSKIDLAPSSEGEGNTMELSEINATARVVVDGTFDSHDAEIDQAAAEPDIRTLNLGGVIYTTILNPLDNRKNWQNLLKTFCWALRDKFDATLLIKFVHHSPRGAINEAIGIVANVLACRCRVVVIGAYLDDESYKTLMNITTYAVNASTGEGQCLPLMEYMSAGIPAIAPSHSALADYLNSDNAFVVSSSAEPAGFPHDPRGLNRTYQQRINLDSLANAFRESYYLVQIDAVKYRKKCEAAHNKLNEHCSDEQTLVKLDSMIKFVERQWAKSSKQVR